MAVTWEAVDFEAETIEVRGTVIREKGMGLRIKPTPKSKSVFEKGRRVCVIRSPV